MHTLDYNVIFVDLPCRTKGLVVKNDDDTYTIMLNSRLSYEQQQQTLKHELHHILNGDYDSDSSVSELEFSAQACY